MGITIIHWKNNESMYNENEIFIQHKQNIRELKGKKKSWTQFLAHIPSDHVCGPA